MPLTLEEQIWIDSIVDKIFYHEDFAVPRHSGDRSSSNFGFDSDARSRSIKPSIDLKDIMRACDLLVQIRGYLTQDHYDYFFKRLANTSGTEIPGVGTTLSDKLLDSIDSGENATRDIVNQHRDLALKPTIQRGKSFLEEHAQVAVHKILSSLIDWEILVSNYIEMRKQLPFSLFTNTLVTQLGNNIYPNFLQEFEKLLLEKNKLSYFDYVQECKKEEKIPTLLTVEFSKYILTKDCSEAGKLDPVKCVEKYKALVRRGVSLDILTAFVEALKGEIKSEEKDRFLKEFLKHSAPMALIEPCKSIRTVVEKLFTAKQSERDALDCFEGLENRAKRTQTKSDLKNASLAELDYILAGFNAKSFEYELRSEKKEPALINKKAEVKEAIVFVNDLKNVIALSTADADITTVKAKFPQLKESGGYSRYSKEKGFSSTMTHFVERTKNFVEKDTQLNATIFRTKKELAEAKPDAKFADKMRRAQGTYETKELISDKLKCLLAELNFREPVYQQRRLIGKEYDGRIRAFLKTPDTSATEKLAATQQLKAAIKLGADGFYSIDPTFDFETMKKNKAANDRGLGDWYKSLLVVYESQKILTPKSNAISTSSGEQPSSSVLVTNPAAVVSTTVANSSSSILTAQTQQISDDKKKIAEIIKNISKISLNNNSKLAAFIFGINNFVSQNNPTLDRFIGFTTKAMLINSIPETAKKEIRSILSLQPVHADASSRDLGYPNQQAGAANATSLNQAAFFAGANLAAEHQKADLSDLYKQLSDKIESSELHARVETACKTEDLSIVTQLLQEEKEKPNTPKHSAAIEECIKLVTEYRQSHSINTLRS